MATKTKLHYNKEALLKDYKQTYIVMIAAVAIVVAIALVYFFVLATYLGGWSHTPGTDFVEQFGDRIEIDYDGLKLPMYGGADE